uniref:CSON010384 protein n=1 Tax=Culicoides sonorensis TaxID=179676 RepID=A0A336LLU8_CULSO
MGNNLSHESNKNKLNSSKNGASGSFERPSGEILTPAQKLAQSETKGMTRSASGADIQEQRYGNFLPIEKLAKALAKKTDEEFGLSNGIVGDIFAKTVFPNQPELGHRLFAYLHHTSKAKTKHLGVLAFRQQVERFIGLLDDSVILENYVKMFGEVDKPEMIRPNHLRELLTTCYRLSMSHYSGGTSSDLLFVRTIDAVINSCFLPGKEYLSSGYVAKFLEQHCPRLIIPPLHKFCVHMLTTAYHSIESNTQTNAEGVNLDISTPVLDKGNPFTEESSGMPKKSLLPVSEAWILSGTLPKLYTRPHAIPKSASSGASGSGTNLASITFMTKLLSTVPSHWTLLYDSQVDGLGANRFLHHVLGYKGPTLTLLKGDNDLLVCVASPSEWRESYMYQGGDEACIVQLLPKYVFIEHGPQSMYLNTSIRGYPKGLRAGKDPRKPIIAVDEGFEKFDFKGISNTLYTIEVWGCGDQKSRETQIEIKKWQVKEAEKQRSVKMSAAEWLDNPDRYLLELGGRPQYNNTGK